MKPRKGLTPETAREILDRCQAHGNFHALPSATVESLLVFADEYKYRKPRNAYGSRGRYFHALLQRRATLERAVDRRCRPAHLPGSDATNDSTWEYRAQEALPVNGQPSFYGQYRPEPRAPWRTAASDYGMIRYTTEAHAIAGAKVYAVEREAREAH